MGYRCVPLCPDAYVVAKDTNSRPHAFIGNNHWVNHLPISCFVSVCQWYPYLINIGNFLALFPSLKEKGPHVVCLPNCPIQGENN